MRVGLNVDDDVGKLVGQILTAEFRCGYEPVRLDRANHAGVRRSIDGIPVRPIRHRHQATETAIRESHERNRPAPDAERAKGRACFARAPTPIAEIIDRGRSD